MCLKKEAKELLKEEKLVQVEINNCIDEFKNIKFNAGAGAGKTHALKESLIYIVNEYGKKLQYHNQNILCITYTNIATKEIKERLGNSTLVNVSTIHERVWALIKNYEEELVSIHKVNVSKLLKELEKNIEDTSIKEYKEFQSLLEDKKKEFISLIETKRDFFYQNRDKKVGELKELFSEEFSKYFKTKGAFVKTVKIIYKINDYSKCIERINLKEEKYKKIYYDSQKNNDSLHRMRISHDTLLEYGLEIIKKYDLLKQLIINKYPYILVDEYQDTDKKVVKILSLLAEHAKKIKYKIFIGYFGDTAQNIYSEGIGEKIDDIHLNLTNVYKKFNRRSAQEIINVINKIRNDKIKQKSIYEDNTGGSVKFYSGDVNSIEKFIGYYKKEWNINSENRLHCLVLKNELVAKYNGFENIYNCLKKVKQYSGANYNALNGELVVNDVKKLGDVQVLIYHILDFKHALSNPDTSINDFLKEEVYKNFSFQDLYDCINSLKTITGDDLNAYVESLFDLYNSKPINKGVKEKIDDIFSHLSIKSYDDFITYLFDKLYRGIDDEKIEVSKENLNSLLTINIEEYNKWFDFVNETENSDIIYHTYHGTKGSEYDNVLIIMEKKFNKIEKFPLYFKNINHIELHDAEFINTKNLLYVSCSRAIKNLRIFYTDDVTEFENEIEEIFGSVHEYIVKEKENQ